MRIAYFSGGANSIGRGFCIWLIASELGWECVPIVPEGQSWTPLAGSQFGSSLAPYRGSESSCYVGTDLVICYQAVPETMNPAAELSERLGVPILLDVDEPHWEARYGFSRMQQLRVVLGMLRRGRNPAPYHVLRRKARGLPAIVSNPCLLEIYPGTVIPHVRKKQPFRAPSVQRLARLRVAFVGTPRPEKGIAELRAACANVGAELHITADCPDTPHENEVWHGETTIEDGTRILDTCHVVAIPSWETPFRRAQLPVKLIDAMLAGKAIVASDLPPIRWALGDTGALVPPGRADVLARALAQIGEDPDLALELGRSARERASRLFTPQVVAPLFRAAVEDALRG